MNEQRLAWGLGGLLVGAVIAHFASPGFFDGIVPEALPGSARTWTYLSGVAEAATGAAVLYPGTRRRGGYVAAALFVAVFPANIKDAVDAFRDHESGGTQIGTLLRLPVQIPLVLWGLRVGRGRPRS